MSSFTMAKVKVEGRETLPDTFQEYVIKKDGVEIGTLKYDRGRWKSCGGPAWMGTQYSAVHFGNISYWAKDRKEVLEWFKTGVMKR